MERIALFSDSSKIMSRYKNLFFDLDDTLWAFSSNARTTFQEVYFEHGLDGFFPSFDHYYNIYQQRNTELWVEYGAGRITKDELNKQRFLYPLTAVGHPDEELAKTYSDDFFQRIPLKSGLMPHAKEVLDYLSSRYNLYILSNGFRELQTQKMQSAGIDGYFKRVILSEDLGLHKPAAQLFHFALSATQSEARNTLMIGDSWSADIEGAKGVGVDQAYYSLVEPVSPLPFQPTYFIDDLRQLKSFL